MLPISLRLSLRQEKDFFLDPRLERSAHLTVFIQPSEENGLRAAILVKKTHGGAVQRAKIRRILRSALVGLWKENPALFAQPFAAAILPRGPSVAQAVYQQELKEIFTRLAAA
jgi:ribonuclease P protein component